MIAPSRRPDGTLRKPIRVRAGYTPIEENLYKGPEVQRSFLARSGLPPGCPPPEAVPPTAGRGGSSRSSGFPPGYVPDTTPSKPAKPAKIKEKPPVEPKAAVTNKVTPAAQPSAASAESTEKGGKPENRLRNLRKKLLEITTLEERAAVEGEGALTKELKQKINRKEALEAEVAELEQQLSELKV